MTQTKSHLRLRALCEGAIFIALAQVLSYLKLYELPQGGSITIEMLPIFLYCARWGFGPGMLASFAYSILQALLSSTYAWTWQSLIGDYLLAFTALGLAGSCAKLKGGFFLRHGRGQRGSLSRALCRRCDGLGGIHARDFLRSDDDDAVVLLGTV